VDDKLEDALKDADAINILRIQLERAAGGFFPTTREYARLWGINRERLALCKPDVAKSVNIAPRHAGVKNISNNCILHFLDLLSRFTKWGRSFCIQSKKPEGKDTFDF